MEYLWVVERWFHNDNHNAGVHSSQLCVRWVRVYTQYESETANLLHHLRTHASMVRSAQLCHICALFSQSQRSPSTYDPGAMSFGTCSVLRMRTCSTKTYQFSMSK
jgi:hypothetical protein